MEERCELCRFYQGDYAASVVEAIGRCRRYPPVEVFGGSTFPSTFGKDWCGEFANEDTAKRDVEARNQAITDVYKALMGGSI
jgi:hypothetical protein